MKWILALGVLAAADHRSPPPLQGKVRFQHMASTLSGEMRGKLPRMIVMRSLTVMIDKARRKDGEGS